MDQRGGLYAIIGLMVGGAALIAFGTFAIWFIRFIRNI